MRKEYWRTLDLQLKEETSMSANNEIIRTLMQVIEVKDRYTAGHSNRVAEYTVKIARELGYNEMMLERFYSCAMIHDIGKTKIPDSILNKTGMLTTEEYEVMKKHTDYGYEILKGITYMPELALAALYHHERADGQGYHKIPLLRIPRIAQVISVADAFDAMNSDRPYRSRLQFDNIINIIKNESGKQFVPDVVVAFLNLAERGELLPPSDIL